MKRAILFCVFMLAAPAQASGFWDSWWHNADQQGEQLLQQGKAAEAARTYSDPRRKAYAELQAGDYSDAAKHFAAFDDSDGNYNRGNALAQAGQLQEAIKAYDAALAQDPHNQDARYNRDLVAKALQQQQQQQQQPSSQNNASPQNGENGNNSQGGQSSDHSGNQNAGKQGNAQNTSSGQNSSAQNSSGQNSAGRNQSGQQQQGKAGQGTEDRNGGRNAEQGQPQSALANQSGSAGQTGSSNETGSPSPSDEAAQAQRDALAALGKTPAGKAAATTDVPVSEQQLAEEQWLRRIPDDPGGLLRRKFMIEHMIRQQGGQQ